MNFTINAQAVEVEFDLRTSLLDLLRENLGLMGSKKGCNQGACGACTVLVDGERINSCLAFGDGASRHQPETMFLLRPEEAAFDSGFVTLAQLQKIVGEMPNCEYRSYLETEVVAEAQRLH